MTVAMIARPGEVYPQSLKAMEAFPVMLSVACNDPNNGIFSGRAMGIELPGDALELEADDWEKGVAFREVNGGFRLSGSKTWPVTSSKYGVGNWCWNGYWMTAAHVADFLAWLKTKTTFSCSCGWTDLHEWFNDPNCVIDRTFLLKQIVEAQMAQRP